MSAGRTYSVAVTVAGGDGSALLRLVATLHRRGVELLRAELDRPGADRQHFAATFTASPQKARLVAVSLRNLVDVVGVQLSEAGGPVSISPVSISPVSIGPVSISRCR